MRARFGKTTLTRSLLVAGALLVYWLLAVSVSPRMGVTGDEIVHITGGYSYWKFNDYRLHPENGNLAQRLAAWPLQFIHLGFPDLSDPDWQNAKVNLVGEKFFFHEGNSFPNMLLAARMMIALTGAFTVWLIWRWARGLFGPAAGWLALGLAVFCPTLLAHGGLATSDMVMTASTLAALSVYWLLLHRATWLRLTLAALACGLAFLSKMSGVVIVPLMAGLLILRWLRPVPLVLALGPTRWVRAFWARGITMLALTLVVAVGSLTVLWAGYGFRYAGHNPVGAPAQDYYFSWEIVLGQEAIPLPGTSAINQLRPPPPAPNPGTLDRLVGWLREHRLLPEAYLWGFAQTKTFAQQRPAYFLGKLGNHGWVAFFPVAFLLKTTPAALVLGLAGISALVLNLRQSRTRGIERPTPGRSWLYHASPLLIFFAGYWLVALTMNLNIGHRHILPTYPVFYVLASAAVLWRVGAIRRTVTAALFVLIGLQAADSSLARPFYLSYFQPLVGGMNRGYHYLVDSSYDWGQGLPDLEQWLKEKNLSGDRTPVHLSYFGADSPRARHLDVIRFGDEINDRGPRYFPATLRGGWYVISATNFVQTYSPARGPWTPAHAHLYGELLASLQEARARPVTDQARFLQNCMDLELMQTARLCLYLRTRAPLEIIGGSLLVFRLTDAEVVEALRNTPIP